MRLGKVVVLIAVLSAAFALLPARARACACCDGSTVVKVVGWSRDGDAVLLDDATVAACEHRRARAALRRGDQRLACFPNPSTGQMSCGHASKNGAALSRDPKNYPNPVRAVSAGHVRSELSAIAGQGQRPRSLDVRIFAGGEWKPLWKGTVFALFPIDVAGPGFEGSLDDEAEMLVEVTVLPAPDGKQALLAIANHETNPGIGHWGTSLVWVDLPASVGAASGAPSHFEPATPHVPEDVAELRYPDPIVPGPGHFAVYAVGGVGADTIVRSGSRFNDRGLIAHRNGNFSASANLFGRALSRDADSAFARYNLACAYARLGMPELALWQLSALTRPGCAKCPERLARARTDDDLVSLRQRPEFRAIVCGDGGDCFRPPGAAGSGRVEAPAAPSAPASPPSNGQSTQGRAPRSSCDCTSLGNARPSRNSAWVLVIALAYARRRRAVVREKRRFVSVLLVLAPVACGPAHAPSRPSPAAWVSPLGRDHPLVGRVWDVARRTFVSEDALFVALSASTFVGLGEQHDNADHHLFQARVIDALASRGRTPGVVFEMLERDEEPAVRRALEAHPRDPDAISTAVDWAHSGWPPWSLYRPIFAVAVTKGLPLFAGGVDRKAAMQLATRGTDAASPDLVRTFALDAALPGDVRESMRTEMRDAHCGLLPDSMLDGMVFVQRVRDAMLADGLERAGSGQGAVLIAGNGHVRRDRGVPSLVTRHTGVTVLAVGLLEVRNDWSRPAEYASTFGASELPFDYVVFTPRASDKDHCAEIRAKHDAASG